MSGESLAAPAPEDARRAPRHAARDGRRHAGALPELRRRRKDRRQAARTDPGHRRGGSGAGRGRRRRWRCGRAPGVVRQSSGGGDKSVMIWAEPQTNALVVTAPPKVMRSVMTIVDRLDIRRAQVLVEAILVEMSPTRRWTSASTGSSVDTDSDGNIAAGRRLRQPGRRHRHRRDHPGRAEPRLDRRAAERP